MTQAGARRRRVREAGLGAQPPGLSPTATSSAPATSGPIPLMAQSWGAASWVSRSSSAFNVAISTSRY